MALMELAPLQKMRAVERRHMGIHLGRLDTAVTEQLAHKFQRPAHVGADAPEAPFRLLSPD